MQEIRDLVAKLEAGLRARSEGSQGAYVEYEQDRNLLLKIPETRSFIPQFILDSPDAEIAFGHMRNYASGTASWAGRREFVRDNFSALRKHLEQIESDAPMLPASVIENIGLPSVAAQLARAKSLISTDPASAVTKAETSLASACKHIISSEGRTLGKAESLISLVSTVARDILKLDAVFDARSFSGISNQAQLVAEIRNSYGDAHPAPDPENTLAEFAVTTAGNLAILFLKRYEQKVNGAL